MKFNRKIKGLLVYIFMPVIFMIGGYVIVAALFSPFFNTIYAAGGLLITDDRANFSVELYSIFNEGAVDIAESGDLHVSEIDIPFYGNHYAQIRSRRIGLLAPVYFGDDYEILREGVGHNLGSYLPGFGGTILLAGHNTTHFLPLQDIEIDDIIELETNYGRFEYRVVEREVFYVSESLDAFDLGQTEQELLVMYTCYPFDGIVGITDRRLFIFAEKIAGPTVDMMQVP